MNSYIHITIDAHFTFYFDLVVFFSLFSMLSNYYVLFAFHYFPIYEMIMMVLGSVSHHSRLMLSFYTFVSISIFVLILDCVIFGFTQCCCFFLCLIEHCVCIIDTCIHSSINKYWGREGNRYRHAITRVLTSVEWNEMNEINEEMYFVFLLRLILTAIRKYFKWNIYNRRIFGIYLDYSKIKKKKNVACVCELLTKTKC